MRKIICVFYFLAAIGTVFGADEGVRGFISVEPFELRLEALVRVEAFRDAWRIEGEEITPAAKEQILENVKTLLGSGVNLTSKGKGFQFSDQRARFVVYDPSTGYVEDERDAIPVNEAIVGVTLSSVVRDVQELDIEWLWFAPGQEKLPIEIASRGTPAARYVTLENKSTSWHAVEGMKAPELLPVPAVQTIRKAPLKYLLAAALIGILAGAIVVVRKKMQSPFWVPWLVVGSVILGIVAVRYRTETVKEPNAEEVDEIVYSLLRNTYHAFDYRDESAIYDTLEKSIEGDLLEDVYLEIRNSLEVENVGGARVRVYEIALREAKMLEMSSHSGKSFRTHSEWVTIGEVTHWGHTHERTNKYEAEITVDAVEGTWKLANLELLNEERIQKTTRRVASPKL